ncbi:MAG: ATP-binding protein [Muribaculaceae bacterium]|nr:ATP-binding protein [Muribaculaceae bacterium]
MNTLNIIGRKEEIRKLKKCYESSMAQLVIVYGRRRVGKTFLVSELFRNCFTLRLTGAYNQPKEIQLQHFADDLRHVYHPDLETPTSWKEAFLMLRSFVESLPGDERQLIFIDEIPWMDSPKSDFLPSFEYFWNSFGAQQSNLMLIVCGSATAWMTENFADNPGGLFNRHATRIYLHPFTLCETEEYLKSRHIEWSRYDIVECYMAMGGIPFYLNQLDEELSYSANIDNLFFRQKGGLWDEFRHLYRTLFRNSDLYVKVVEALSSKKMGMTRNEISVAAKIPNNGDLTRVLQNLVDSDFVRQYYFFGNKRKNMVFQLCDNYTLFYFRFIKDNYGRDERFWTNTLDSPARRAWAGNAFELVCKSHIQQIKRKLGILGVLSQDSVWFSVPENSNDRGAQIDMIIDRRDRVVNLCEMKYSINPFTIDRDYEMQLRNKIEAFREATHSRSALHLTMITTYGVKRNAHSGIVQSEVTIDDLFAPYAY